ncbi:hypothetical protein ACTXT7_017540 [Hymenolepis weldensis]
MRTEYVVFVCALFVAGSIMTAEAKLQVPKNCKGAAETVLGWMFNKNVTGQDAWVLQMYGHLNCSRCALFGEKNLDKWPSNCNSCTDLFWDYIKHWKSCKSCKQVNWYCDTCRNHFTTALKTSRANREKLMNKYLSDIQFV